MLKKEREREKHPVLNEETLKKCKIWGKFGGRKSHKIYLLAIHEKFGLRLGADEFHFS